MDALGLLPPAAGVANATPTPFEGNALDGAAGTEALDFAALLAAGLMPPLQPDMLPPAAPAPAEATSGAEIELPELPRGAPAALLGTAQALAAAGKRGDDAQAPAPLHATTAATASAMHAAQEPAPGAHPATLAASAGSAADLAAALTARAHDAERQTDVLATQTAVDALAPGTPTLIEAPVEHRAHAQPLAVLEVGARIDTPQFAPALSQQVVWMADKDAHVAELRINPPELGPVEVRLQLKGDEAAVQFVSAHAEVRDALEGSLARLRDSLAQAGIQLGEASIGADSFRGQQHANGGNAGNAPSSARDADTSWSVAQPAARLQHGLVDLFA